jgi:cytidylate kinase
MQGTVVTFSVQVGSDGFSIARAVAEKLGFRYYDWAITSKTLAALDFPLSEAGETRGLVDKMLVRLAVAHLLEEEVPEGMVGSGSIEMANQAIRSLSDDSLRCSIERMIGELATAGSAVIVGHGSQVILQDWPGVFKVLIRGSTEARARRIASSQALTYQDTLAAMDDSDSVRANFFRRAYEIDWLDNSLYDLVVSTDEVEVEVAAQFVAAAASNMRGFHRLAAVVEGRLPAVGTPAARPLAA